MSLLTRHSRNFRRAAWLAVLAVVLQMLVPLMHQPARVMLAGGVMRICSSLINQAPADADKAPTHKLPPCPICQNLHMLGHGFVPPNTVVLAHVASGGETLALPALKPVVLLRVISNAQPRAPPILA